MAALNEVERSPHGALPIHFAQGAMKALPPRATTSGPPSTTSNLSDTFRNSASTTAASYSRVT